MVNLLIDVHTDGVELVDVSVSCLEQVTDFYILAALIRDQILELSLLFLVLGEDVEILHLHRLIVVSDLFDILLGLFILAELVHENLVVVLQFLDLLTIL